MPRAEASAQLSHSPAAVWEVVAAYDAIDSWHPLIANCAPEPGPPYPAPGHIRRLHTSDGELIRERLLQLSGHTCVYEFVESPFPVTAYRATLRLAPGPTTGTCVAHWWGDFSPEDPADTDALTALFAEKVFAVGLGALGDYLEDSPGTR